MATVSEILTRVRDRLDEVSTTGGQWTQPQLRRWYNDALNDIARFTHHLTTSTDIAVAAGAAEVNIPGTVLEIQHVYYAPDGGTEVIPLTAYHWDAMDAIWGSWQNHASGDPSAYAPWGYSPNLKVRLYPVPSRAGNLRVFHAKQPTPITTDSNTNDGSTVDLPDAWCDLVVDYIEYMALRKDRDPRWQEVFDLYTRKREDMAQHDYLAQARDIVHDYGSGGLPRWLVDPGW